MRKWNAILTMGIMVLFLLHAILGGFQLLGAGSTALKTVAWIDLGLILLHTAIGVKLTADTVRVRRKTGVGYFRENRLFWARRISGLAIMVFLVFHLVVFRASGSGGSYRLPWFTAGRLMTQLLLVATIAVHVISNIRPVMIALGIPGLKKWAADILLVLSVLMLFLGAAFIVYYLRWNVF